MGTAAKLHAEARDCNNTDDIAVFLAEKCHSALFACFILLHVGYFHILTLQDDLIYELLYISKLLLRNRLEVREVKTQTFWCYQRTCLIDLISDDLLQCCLHQMCCRVIACGCQLTYRIYFNLYGIPNLKHTFFHV